jgi:hypothetical protein
MGMQMREVNMYIFDRFGTSRRAELEKDNVRNTHSGVDLWISSATVD